MKLKKDYWQVSADIQARAQSMATSAFYNAMGHNDVTGPIANAISQAIAMAVAEGFRVMMENQYTDEDFERDIGIKD